MSETSLEAVTSDELEGFRVLELGGGIPAAYAARIFGDFGADVTKVEPVGGDLLRDPDAPGGVGGALFEYLNWNKSSVALDLEDVADLARLRDLVTASDVVFTGLAPNEAAALGLDLSSLREWNQRAVVISVTPFGASGPYSDWASSELILQAMGGVMTISGTTDRGPLMRGLRQTHFYAGLNAAWAALAGLYAARVSGAGVEIDLAVRECVSAELVMNQSLYAFLGVVQSRPPAAADPFGGFPLPCSDGYVTIQASTAAPMSALAELFGEPSLNDPKYASKEGRTSHARELLRVLAPRLASVRGREFFVDASRSGYLVGFVQSATEMLSCEQLAARGATQQFPEYKGHDGTPVRFPASLGRLSGRTVKRPARRAPRLGQSSEKVTPASATLTGAKPFSGLRVLDLSQVFAGPYLGGLLSDLGADVIKIEAPHRLDQARTDYGGYFDNVTGDDPWNRTSTFQVLNRNKRSISLDLKTEQGKQLLRDLVADADILIENFTPRVLPGLGLGYQELKRINPALVMVSNSGFGATGPWSSFKAQGTTLEATMGFCSYTGYSGGPPSKAGQSYPDFIAAWTGLIGVLAALVRRLSDGEGQWIDLGMYELGIAMMPEALLHLQLSGQEIERSGNSEFGAIASGVVRCTGAERWMAFSVGDAQGLTRLSRVVEAGLDTASAVEVVGSWARHRSVQDAVEALQDAGLAAGPVNDAHDLLLDPQMSCRGFYELVSDIPGMGDRPVIGRPFTWAGGRIAPQVRHRAPRFAEHTEELLLPVLGSSPALEDAVSAGAVALAPRDPLPARPNDYEAMLRSRSITSFGGDYVDDLRSAIEAWAPRADANLATADGRNS